MRSILFALAALVAVGCGAVPGSGDDNTRFASASDNSCHMDCQNCPPNRVCALSCVLRGNCTTRCNRLELCVEGYRWSETACQCLPDNGDHGGAPCGNTTCTGSDVCCNSSCGICTPPGGVCIQLACAAF